MDKITKILLDYTSGKTPLGETNRALEDAGSDIRLNPAKNLFTPEELGNRGELLAVITLEPGESVGVHPHTSNGEAYFILEGGATMTEDDETRILGVGDAEFCADGHTHSIKNHTDKPMRFLAVIFPNK